MIRRELFESNLTFLNEIELSFPIQYLNIFFRIESVVSIPVLNLDFRYIRSLNMLLKRISDILLPGNG